MEGIQNEVLTAEQKKEILTHAGFVNQLDYRMEEYSVPEEYRVAIANILRDRFVRKYSSADFEQVFPDNAATVEDYRPDLQEQEVWDTLAETADADPGTVTEYVDLLEGKMKEAMMRVYE